MKIREIGKKLDVNIESTLFSINGEFVPEDQEVGEAEEIKVHRVIAGG
ncbi:MAG: Sulfur transfer protein involved in thiamine biosynthesis ThiS [Candidatus Methanohalarchaeum thermophilum]|uniref:Sulfur transfer protein involved in thiamine biosynthesis ThiS n=1 Tax=Methanohalarchaeum thermophilum TaxID=1903181 RepID=A0A1Q6DUK8_METT1|nr:MAG: Sulfur transfer protein involved in thiamine biosynthesis ThiS [Candidatus Methanohalarchaeum thermophilum]